MWIFPLLYCLASSALIAFASLDEKRISITESNLGRKHFSGELIFSDEFDTLNLETWRHENTLGTKNWEFQMYTNSRRNSYAQDGSLYIRPTLTSDHFGVGFLYNGQWDIEGSYPENLCTDPIHYGCKRAGHYPNLVNPIMSAKLKTDMSFYFKYGRVEVRAKVPGGDWMWPSIMMMPRFNSYGPWPCSGEIDIMESRGNQQLLLFLDEKTSKNVGSEIVTSTLHFGPQKYMDPWYVASQETQSPPGWGFDREFHVYGVTWTDERIEFTLDGNVTRIIQPPYGGFFELGEFSQTSGIDNPWKHSGNKRMAPFDQKFYLILNVAVGSSNFFPDHWVNGKGKKPWSNDSPVQLLHFFEGRNDWYPTWQGDAGAFQIDYVRVYAI